MNIIYKTTNLINGNFYIGQHKCLSEMFDGYFGSGLLLNYAIKKHGKENFKRETLEVCDKNIVNEREIYWIEKLNPKYNITKGGCGGFTRVHDSEAVSLKQEENIKSDYVRFE